ncbi:uncharacterized protein CDAR_432771 [Caerostris darwini]|uniref:Uncharacterized protein n=1 Tax=Caerostris darwini TaxID=1538125 RepID=A0AAV4QJX7_9ARAC|nr:uncharacterized protein CDAR_432771 [Caerostris darwini]
MDTMKSGVQAIFDLIVKTTGAKDGKLPINTIISWLKHAGIVGKDTGISESDVRKTHSKAATDKKNMDLNDLQQTITNIAKQKDLDPKTLLDKLSDSGPPQMEKDQSMAEKFISKFKK